MCIAVSFPTFDEVEVAGYYAQRSGGPFRLPLFRAMLADANVQGQMKYIQALMDHLGLWRFLDDENLRFVTFPDLELDLDLDDRLLWNRCQEEGWVLFTDNRNEDGHDSLEATPNG